MTITREELDSLQAGDVVELAGANWPDVVMRGPLRADDHGCLMLGEQPIRLSSRIGNATLSVTHRLTVVSRAPRPLYVNHPRTEPIPGDVVRDADKGPTRWPVWVRQASRWAELKCENSCTWRGPTEMPARLRLLVDGETGQVVP